MTKWSVYQMREGASEPDVWFVGRMRTDYADLYETCNNNVLVVRNRNELPPAWRRGLRQWQRYQRAIR